MTQALMSYTWRWTIRGYIAEICAENDNVNVLDRIMLFLSNRGANNPKKSFEIIMKLVDKSLDLNIQFMGLL